MAEILYAYMVKLLTVARLLENATALVVSSSLALPVKLICLPANLFLHQTHMKPHKLSPVSASHASPGS